MGAAAKLDATFQALADPTRRGVVDLLRVGPKRAGDLSRRLRISPPALSRHLRVLRSSGLVQEERSPDDARARVYRLRRERFLELQAWLTEVELFWSDQLDAFKVYAEAKARKAPRGTGR